MSKVINFQDRETLMEDMGKNEELISREQVDDSPFWIIGIDGKYFGAMGRYRLTEPTEDVDSLREELRGMTWNRLIQVIEIILDSHKNDIINN